MTAPQTTGNWLFRENRQAFVSIYQRNRLKFARKPSLSCSPEKYRYISVETTACHEKKQPA